ncbi:hypothetical protein APHAL10511_003860 [Amanita phalloides]|nr:hypothetical protein APHAL10511_003860 [Amanita phalloides]
MVQIVYDKIIDFCGLTEIPCVIAGSKCDLLQNRQVELIEGQRLAEANKAAFLETSAKENINVGKVFETVLAEIEKRTSTHAAEPQTSRCSLSLLSLFFSSRKIEPSSYCFMDINFRKIDIDAYDEDVLHESDICDPDPRDPSQVVVDAKQKQAAVRSALARQEASPLSTLAQLTHVTLTPGTTLQVRSRQCCRMRRTG